MGGCSHVLSSWAGGKVTFREFLSVLGARWRIIALSVLVAVGAAAVQTMLTPAVYTSSSTIYLSATGPATEKEPAYGSYIIQASDLKRYVAVLGSSEVLDPLRERLGLAADTPVAVDAAVSDTNLMVITTTGADPNLVARTANEAGPVLAQVAKKFSPLLAANGQSVSSTTITPAAAAAGEPTSPNAKRNLMLGGLVGLGIGIGIALLAPRRSTRRCATRRTSRWCPVVPCSGTSPSSRMAKNDRLSVDTDPHGRHAEAIRRLRTNILFVDVTTGSPLVRHHLSGARRGQDDHGHQSRHVHGGRWFESPAHRRGPA